MLSVVEKCLARIEKHDAFQESIQKLAQRHIHYGARPVYILCLFGCLRQALLEELEGKDGKPFEGKDNNVNQNEESIDSFTIGLDKNTVNAAWNRFFRLLGLALLAEILTQEEVMANQNLEKGPETPTKQENNNAGSPARMENNSTSIVGSPLKEQKSDRSNGTTKLFNNLKSKFTKK